MLRAHHESSQINCRGTQLKTEDQKNTNIKQSNRPEVNRKRARGNSLEFERLGQEMGFQTTGIFQNIQSQEPECQLTVLTHKAGASILGS